jgi:hypothetical protein
MEGPVRYIEEPGERWREAIFSLRIILVTILKENGNHTENSYIGTGWQPSMPDLRDRE